MNSHFLSLVSRLSLEDIEILNSLNNTDSISRFSARTKREVSKESNMSESQLRKSLVRLEAMNFIDIVAGGREHLLYITDYGQQAILKISEGSHA